MAFKEEIKHELNANVEEKKNNPLEIDYHILKALPGVKFSQQ